MIVKIFDGCSLNVVQSHLSKATQLIDSSSAKVMLPRVTESMTAVFFFTLIKVSINEKVARGNCGA